MSISKYYDEFNGLVSKIVVADTKGTNISFADGADKFMALILEQHKAGKKLLFIGNGGSAGIASHMAVDFWKNGGIKAQAFNDSSLLTCIGNDYGYEYVFAKPIEMFAEEGDILVAISSSGKSKNILNGVKAAQDKKCKVVTLSGFDVGNPLFKMGELNFYVPSKSYGQVELIHQSILHYVLDMMMEKGGYQGDLG
ncbi:MAG: SIS domain-containing protein [Candidatus Saganbacteria bacterium]|nr:SIS domain-containing protein [Candidatus Saganbacteria bacterium]